jgi:hypothetical protein
MESNHFILVILYESPSNQSSSSNFHRSWQGAFFGSAAFAACPTRLAISSIGIQGFRVLWTGLAVESQNCSIGETADVDPLIDRCFLRDRDFPESLIRQASLLCPRMSTSSL